MTSDNSHYNISILPITIMSHYPLPGNMGEGRSILPGGIFNIILAAKLVINGEFDSTKYCSI